ncbi:hypothetical protein [Streptomyces virginiae]
MLLALTGSSCSGRTTLAYAAGERLGQVADRQWRNRMTEMWVNEQCDVLGSGRPALARGWSRRTSTRADHDA